MTRQRVLYLLTLFALPSLWAQAAPNPRLGTVVFPTSGSPAAQAAFLLGVRYLHSFQYESAEKAFRQAEALEPGFALAYWGEAMTYNHPVWNEQDSGAARAALRRLAPTPEARRAKAPTAREQRYLDAVEVLYGPGGKARRDTLYAAAMARLVREEPEDLEAKAFYALALLGLNQGIRDTVAYLRAAHYADTVFRANPDHPGAAHYLIHSYDDPVHARLGLAAARAYSTIAPDAAHAQHMTTHIFLAMGMWDEVVSQNRIAVGLTALLPGHYSSWLVYGLIQQGRHQEATELMVAMWQKVGSGGTRAQATALSDMQAHFTVHVESLERRGAFYLVEKDKLTVPGVVVASYQEGLGSFRVDAFETVAESARELARLAEALRVDRGKDDPAAVAAKVMAREMEGIRLLTAGSRDEGLRVLREATALEDAMAMEFGPPVIIEPSHELLGTVLLQAKLTDANLAEAKLEFERALRLAPGRSRSLVGLVRAAVATGDKTAAQAAVEALARNWRNADGWFRSQLADLAEMVAAMP